MARSEAASIGALFVLASVLDMAAVASLAVPSYLAPATRRSAFVKGQRSFLVLRPSMKNHAQRTNLHSG